MKAYEKPEINIQSLASSEQLMNGCTDVPGTVDGEMNYGKPITSGRASQTCSWTSSAS